MRITFLSPPPNLSGGERVVAIYARELIELGHDVEIVCSRNGARSLKSWVTRFLSTGHFSQPRAPVNHYQNYKVPFRLVDHCNGVLDQDIPNADIVIATFWITALWLDKLGPQKGRPIYLVQHDEGSLFGPAADATYQIPMTHVYVSDWIADRVRTRHPKAMGEIILNAVDVADFQQGSRCRPAVPTFGMMWSRARFKDSRLAIDAVLEARRRGATFNLIAYSTARPPAQILETLQCFKLHPSSVELASIYGECTAWLFSSREEGFGLPILESMAAGTPVIGTRTGAAPRLIEEDAGILVPCEEVAPMVEAIIRFCDMSEDEWTRLSRVAYQKACSHTWQDAARQFEKLLLSEL